MPSTSADRFRLRHNLHGLHPDIEHPTSHSQADQSRRERVSVRRCARGCARSCDRSFFQTLFDDASDVANYMANRMLNHTLNQPVGQAAIHHAFERLSDVVFDVVADPAFKNGATRFSNRQISEITEESCVGIILAFL